MFFLEIPGETVADSLVKSSSTVLESEFFGIPPPVEIEGWAIVSSGFVVWDCEAIPGGGYDSMEALWYTYKPASWVLVLMGLSGLS